jgi:hypothetical protein
VAVCGHVTMLQMDRILIIVSDMWRKTLIEMVLEKSGVFIMRKIVGKSVDLERFMDLIMDAIHVLMDRFQILVMDESILLLLIVLFKILINNLLDVLGILVLRIMN